TWHAYLSTQTTAGAPAVDARDRIGHGPSLIARDLDELHGTNMLTKQTALTEKGAVVNGRGDTPNMHDILTGSQPDGKAFPPDKDMTCKNWTSSTGGAAMLGHSDRTGLTDDPPGRSWNSSHPSRDCSQDGLKSTGGAGLFYCFAMN
ncbi:MAG: lectin, partial [Xanthobacteraceae bacterium]